MSDFERYAVQRVLDRARAAGVPNVPDIGMIFCGQPASAGALAYAEAHPELIDADGFALPEAICCSGVGFSGRLEDCTCWRPVYAEEQADPIPPVIPADLSVQPRRCGDCAYRPGSPERETDYEREALLRLAYPATARVPLRNRHGEVVAEAIVDRTDFEQVNRRRWYRGGAGYAIRFERHGKGRRTAHLLHREIMGLEPGDAGEVDHRNRNPLDCRRANLRVGTHALNLQNRGPNRGRKLGRGVSFDKRRGKWEAYVRVDGKLHHLGRYGTPEEADAVVKAARAALMPWSIEAEGPLEGPPYFFCHEGMRRPVKWVHLTHGELPGSSDDWKPPIIDGIPYRADGRPAMLCAGWTALRVRALERDEGGSVAATTSRE